MERLEIPKDSRKLSEIFWEVKNAIPSAQPFNVAETAGKRWIYSSSSAECETLKAAVLGLLPIKRNLCYYMYPIKNSLWTFHIEQLKRYLDVFNGKKIITIAVDERSVSEDEVRKALKRDDIHWRVVKNDAKLWETAAFPGMLELVESLDPNEFTFYAHAKGVRRPDWAIENARIWSGTMYFLNLSSVSMVNRILSKYDGLGCYRHQVNHCGSNWHFSGTYFWFRHSTVFSKAWRNIYPHLYGVEGWIGQYVDFDRSYSLISPQANLEWGTAIKEHCVGLMKKHLNTWMVKEPAKEDLFLI